MSYKFSEHTIQLEQHDCDVNLRLPSGQIISLQYRVEAPSIDICLPENLAVTNWQGDDMEPALTADGFPEGNVHLAKQLVIDLNPAWVDV